MDKFWAIVQLQWGQQIDFATRRLAFIKLLERLGEDKVVPKALILAATNEDELMGNLFRIPGAPRSLGFWRVMKSCDCWADKGCDCEQDGPPISMRVPWCLWEERVLNETERARILSR